MQDIDFLPVDYRQNRVERRWKPWRIVVVLCFAGLISAAALGQRHHRRQLETDLEAIGPQRARAEQQNARLTDLQSRLKEALAQGVESAINSLGKTDGFLANDLVRIAMPDQVSPVAGMARKFGAGSYVDSFETTMNRAAESSAPPWP